MKGRVVSQEQQAKRALTEAHEAGDYEKVAEAQSALSQGCYRKRTHSSANSQRLKGTNSKSSSS